MAQLSMTEVQSGYSASFSATICSTCYTRSASAISPATTEIMTEHMLQLSILKCEMTIYFSVSCVPPITHTDQYNKLLYNQSTEIKALNP